MRDIKSIRGDMFAYGVPFKLVQELEEASKDEGAKCMDCEVYNEAVAAKALREALELQKKNYGDAMDTHIELSTWACKYAALATPESKDPK